MGAVVVPIIIALAVLVIAVVGLRRLSRDERRHADDLRTPGSLRYRVPAGQDPAVVLAALGNAGYDAAPDSTTGVGPELLIRSGDGTEPDREEVRRVLSSVRTLNPEGDQATDLPEVRFTDEGNPPRG